MRRLLCSLALSALFVGMPQPAVAGAPTELAAVGPWEIAYDEDSCRMTRGFGTGRNQIIAQLTQYVPANVYYLDLFGERLRTSALGAQVTLDFGPETGPVRYDALAGRTPNKPILKLGQVDLADRQFTEGSPPTQLTAEQEAAITYVDVGYRRTVYRLQLGHMHNPMEAMRTCLTDLVRHWGYDPAAHAAQTRAATPLTAPQTWLNPSDYPLSSLQAGMSSVIQFRLDVDANGTVAGCHVLYRTNGDDFTVRTCRYLTQRARFSPALDAARQPTRSFYVGRVLWLATDPRP